MTPSTKPVKRVAAIPAECKACEITIRPGKTYWHVPTHGSYCVRCAPHHPLVKALLLLLIPSAIAGICAGIPVFA